MGWVTGLTVYFVVWWVIFLMVLPWGSHPPETPGEGHVASAPANPRLGLKFLITTVIAVIIWAGINLLIRMDVIDFYQEAEQMMKEDQERI